MATGGDVSGQCAVSLGSEDLNELKCHPCHEDGAVREAVGICVDCQDYLCQRCFDIHTIPKPCKNHKLFDKEHMLREDIKLQRKDKCTQKCPGHDDKTIKYYCTEHRQLACSVCLSLDHRTCKVQYIPDAAKDPDNNEEFVAIEKQMNSVLELSGKVSAIEQQNIDSIESSSAEALKNVEAHRININDSLDIVQAEIVEKAESMKSNVIKRLAQITGRYSEAQRDVQETKENIDRLRKTHQMCELYTQMMKVKDKVDVLNGEVKRAKSELLCEVKELRFVQSQDIPEMAKVQEAFGKLSEIRTNENIVKAEHAFNINIKRQSDSMCPYVSGSTVLSDGKVVLTDWHNHCIKLVDVRQKKIITSKNISSSPWDLCTVKQNQVAVTITGHRKIAFFSIGNDVTFDRELDVNGQCRGIDCKDVTLAVSFCGPDKVQVMTLQGEILHDIAVDRIGQRLFNDPYHLTFDQNSSVLYVSNTNSNSVVCVKLDRTVVGIYKDDKLMGPRGILVDSNSNVFVCAVSSYNVHQMSPDCKKVRILLGQADGLSFPLSISYNETEKQVYVGMQNDQNIKVYNAIVASE